MPCWYSVPAFYFFSHHSTKEHSQSPQFEAYGHFDAYGKFLDGTPVNNRNRYPIQFDAQEYFLEEFDKAIERLEAVRKLHPEEPNLYNTLNQIYLAQGDYVEALSAINKGLEIVPGEPYFLNNRGMTYLKMDF